MNPDFFDTLWQEIGRVPRMFWSARLARKYRANPASALSTFLRGDDLKERYEKLYREASAAPNPSVAADQLCRAFASIQLASETQRLIPRIRKNSESELAIYVWRVLDDHANERIHRVQLGFPDQVIATPYGIWKQEPEHAPDRAKLSSMLSAGERVSVWRLQFGYRSRPQWSFFWTIGEPPFQVFDLATLRRYMKEFEIPVARARGPAMIITGSLASNAKFLVKPVEKLTSFGGSGVELITTWDGIECDESPEMRLFNRELIQRAFRSNPASSPAAKSQ